MYMFLIRMKYIRWLYCPQWSLIEWDTVEFIYQKHNYFSFSTAASPQPDVCNTNCSVDKVISSSVLTYTENIADDGKILYCTAVNRGETYHCIPLDGRAAFVVQVNVWSLLETTSTGFLSVGTKKKCYHLNLFCVVMVLYLLHKICISIW
jgi:hypothetical protein